MFLFAGNKNLSFGAIKVFNQHGALKLKTMQIFDFYLLYGLSAIIYFLEQTYVGCNDCKVKMIYVISIRHACPS